MKNTPAIILGAAVLSLGVVFSPTVARAFDATQPAGASTSTQAAPVTPGASRAPHGFAALNLTDAQKAQFKSIQDATQAKITAILTPEQQAQLNAALAANPAPAANAPRHGHRNRFMRALRSLNLSDQQRQSIRTIQTDQRAQMMAVLTPDQLAKFKTMMDHRASAGAK